MALSGLLAGMTVLVEYQAAVISALILVYVATQTRRRVVVWVLAALPSAPSAVRRVARERAYAPRRIVIETELEEAGVIRVLSREELYALVWSEPLLTLAKRFGLSDNGLRKRCKAMNVPTPPRGYWQNARHGRRPKLPALSRGHQRARIRHGTHEPWAP